jgi:hypothetical protein
LRLSASVGAGGLAVDAFTLMLEGTDPPKMKQRLQSTWWWMAGRRMRRLVRFLPRIVVSSIKGDRLDPIWLRWHCEKGAMLRALYERRKLTSQIRAMPGSGWASLCKKPVSDVCTVAD